MPRVSSDRLATSVVLSCNLHFKKIMTSINAHKLRFAIHNPCNGVRRPLGPLLIDGDLFSSIQFRWLDEVNAIMKFGESLVHIIVDKRGQIIGVLSVGNVDCRTGHIKKLNVESRRLTR